MFRFVAVLVLGLILVGSSTALTQYDSGYVDFGDSDTFIPSVGAYKQKVVSVKFNKPYAVAPIVIPSVEIMDFENIYNTRWQYAVAAVTTTGFQITMITWGNTKIYNIRVRWHALSL
ncbi:uncharacterized protein LOC131950637 [Physella acuta]|uniref:uncharacterized protein LOC131950637 n=1 Tax=Physella acuta TaxID=109671 RepID=UPI0027DD84E3|nr:uncharacterized protein LOC131950637 [Physella acuta]